MEEPFSDGPGHFWPIGPPDFFPLPGREKDEPIRQRHETFNNALSLNRLAYLASRSEEELWTVKNK